MASGMWQTRGVRQDRGEAVGDHTTRNSDVPRASWQAADDQHKALCSERRGFIYGAPVVVDCCLSSGSIGGRERAAAAIAGNAHAIRFDDAHRFSEPKRRHLVAPGIKSRDAVPRTGLNGLLEIPLLADGSQINRE